MRTGRIIVGIAGASGVIYGIRLLEVLRDLKVEAHLILTEAAQKNIQIETSLTVEDVKLFCRWEGWPRR